MAWTRLPAAVALSDEGCDVALSDGACVQGRGEAVGLQVAWGASQGSLDDAASHDRPLTIAASAMGGGAREMETEPAVPCFAPERM